MTTTATGPKYPDITATLKDDDTTTMTIIGRVRRALRDGGVSQDEIEQFSREALDGNLMMAVNRWVIVK